MSNGNIPAGGAYVRIFTKNQDFTKGLAKASAAFKSWGAGVGRMAVSAGAALSAGLASGLSLLGVAVSAATAVLLPKKFAAAGQAIYSMANALNVSASALSAFDYVASQTGQTVENLMAAMAGGMTRGAALRVNALRKEAQALGLIWSQVDIQQAVMLNREFSKFGVVISNLANRFGAVLAPAASAVLQALTAGATQVNLWLRQNQHLMTVAWTFKQIANAVDNVSKSMGDFVRAVGGALAGGDPLAAWEVIAKGVKVAFLQALFDIQSGWVVFQNTAIDVGANIAKAFLDAFAVIQQAWNNLQSSIRQVFELISGTPLGPGQAQDAIDKLTLLAKVTLAKAAISGSAAAMKGTAPTDKDLKVAKAEYETARLKGTYLPEAKAKAAGAFIPDLLAPPGKQSAQGTFSGFSAGAALGASGYEQRTAENTGRMVALMQQMLSQQRGFK